MRKLFIALLGLTLLSGCWPSSVSFNDTGSMNPCLKTFYMSVLDNSAPNAPINYPIELTEAIKLKVQNNTRLLLTDESGGPQVLIEGKITSYSVTPVALQEGDNAATNRLTVSVTFKIFSSCEEENFEQEMNLVSSRFVDYPAATDISSVETELLEEINTQVAQDVINKLLSNW